MKTISVISILVGGLVTSSCTNRPSEGTREDSSDIVSQTTKEPVLKIDESQQKLATPSAVGEFPIERVFELQQTDGILLIDTRSPIFYKLGHIDGAYSLPLKSFEKRFETSKSTLDSAKRVGKEIVIYCQSEKCPDSYIMAQALSKAGYKVSISKGGWELWKMSGL